MPQVLEKFKKDEINILVATSVAEEGLDIGEIDSIICYDVSKDPTRTVSDVNSKGEREI